MSSGVPSIPFYRTLLHEAWLVAWRLRVGWLVAILAGVFQTGGVFDIIHRLAAQVSATATDVMWINYWRASITLLSKFQGVDQLFFVLRAAQALLLVGVFAVAFLVIAILAQGTLVAMIGNSLWATDRRLRHALAQSAKSFWSLLILNILSLLFIAVGRWFVIGLHSFDNRGQLWLTSGSLIIAMTLWFVVIAMHMFSLQLIVLDRTSVWAALPLAWRLFRRSWFVVIEHGLLLMLIGVALFVAMLFVAAVAVLPFAGLGFGALLLQWNNVVNLLLCGLIIFLFCGGLAAYGFAITFQFAAWHRLFEQAHGGVMKSKLARLLHRAGWWLKGA